MERFAPLILAIYPELRRKLPGSRSLAHTRNQGPIPRPARAISQHHSSDHNANKIGEVLEIEPAESYIKRPAMSQPYFGQVWG